MTKFSLRLEQLTTKILNQNSNSHKDVGLWAKSINHFGNFGRHFPCATSAKILAAMYARVPQAMAQFVLKIEKLSHIMGPTPIIEMARAYGLHPRLWLLDLRTFAPIVSAHPYCARESHATSCHVMYRARALSTKINK